MLTGVWKSIKDGVFESVPIMQYYNKSDERQWMKFPKKAMNGSE